MKKKKIDVIALSIQRINSILQVIFVVNRFKRMRNVTNVFLASLSTADLCLIWICVPVMVRERREGRAVGDEFNYVLNSNKTMFGEGIIRRSVKRNHKLHFNTKSSTIEFVENSENSCG